MDKHNISFEPMDIDLSAHSTSSNDMEISYNEPSHGIEEFMQKIIDSAKSTPTLNREDVIETASNPSGSSIPVNIKKFHIVMQKEPVNSHRVTELKLACAALMLLLSVIAFQVLNIKCCDDINPEKLKKSLSNKLYGQTNAIDALVDGLNVNKTKVLILYGSTGVGKTFAASILLDHVGLYSNVYHYTMPSFMEIFTTDFLIGLTVCKDTIIIIDDLSPNDLDVKIHISNLVLKSQNLDKEVTVLLIFNHCNTAKDFKRQCDESFPDKIMKNLNQIKAYKKMIRFETLTEKHLQKCIETELGERKISSDQFAKVLKMFDVTVDGCKGVHTKMKLLDIS